MPDFGSKKVRIENVRAIYATASALKVEIVGHRGSLDKPALI